MESIETVIIAADEAVVLRQSPLFASPGEIRNKIYDLVFGMKPLRLLPQHIEAHPDNAIRKQTGFPYIPNTENHGLYTLRRTCRQIAAETEHYLFQTLDFSDFLNSIFGLVTGKELPPHRELLRTMMAGHWHHVRHLVISSCDMTGILVNSKRVAPHFQYQPLLTSTSIMSR